MTTAEQPIAVAAATPLADLRPTPWPGRWRRQLGWMAGVSAALIGSQTLAASTPLRSDVRLLLPSEGLLAGLGDGLRRGYSLAMDESRSCGIEPPSLQVGWLPPGAQPQVPVGAAPRSNLLIA
ncbi:MAG: histidine kinase, partial [Vulcanococcus sp.]